MGRSARRFFAAIVPSLTERPSWPEQQKKKQRQAERRGMRSIEPRESTDVSYAPDHRFPLRPAGKSGAIERPTFFIIDITVPFCNYFT